MALRRMVLRDFVIVRELELDAQDNFTVLTGETGAGKSILIDALQWALGARADAQMIRDGAQRADIAAEFDRVDALADWLSDGGFDPSDSLLLRRLVDRQGRSRAWINGSPATLAQLRELSEQLVDIHGQHAWQSLTRPQSVRGLLDRYANCTTDGVEHAWREWRQAEQTLDTARSTQVVRQAERDRLLWQLAEIDKLDPRADEWEELNTQHSRLANAQALLDTVQATASLLESDGDGVSSLLHRARQALADQAHLEPDFARWAEQIDSAAAITTDLIHDLHGYLRRTEPDPQRLAGLDERLKAWISLARRMRRQPAELPGQCAQWKGDLLQLDAVSDIAGLEATRQACEDRYRTAARALSAARAKSAKPLAQAVTAAMQELGMKGGRFEIALTPCEPSSQGLDEVQFLVVGHAGLTPRPVAKVASGGELSRLALAIAVCTSKLGPAQTLIFDEVDSGIGGAVAETVGRLMKQLGRHRQVLCVTHLAQVAAAADHHWVVNKRSAGGVAQTELSAARGEARVEEIARMLGGERRTAASLAHAQDLLDSCSVGALD